MKIYYLWDELLRREKNSRGENHWFVYIKEILSRLGVSGEALTPLQAETTPFGRGDVLFIGADDLAPSLVKPLKYGLERGLTLIGFGTSRADDLFGIETAGVFAQESMYSVNGYFAFHENVQDSYLRVPEKTPPMPVFSPVRKVRAAGAQVLAEIDISGCATPGLLGRGSAYYFAFDLPQMLLVSAQGRPVYEGTERFHVSRIPDTRVTPLDYDTEIAYGDYFVYILQSILAGLGFPMLHRLPPSADGTVPDFLLYYAGDEDAEEAEITLRASEIMHERGLPYHINLMPYGEDMSLVLTPEQYDIIRARGHELAMHYNMVEKYEWSQFTADAFRKQYRTYLQRFGETCVSTVGHCLTHKGWAERARFQAALGIKGDGGRFAEYDPTNINAFNLYGFAFGIAYPMFFYDDSDHVNQKLPFVDMPIAFYEPRVGGQYSDGKEKLQRCLDAAAYFGRMISLFTHPFYVADNSGYESSLTMAAFDEAFRYIKEKGFSVIHSTPDRVCLFWHGRDASRVSGPVYGKNGAVSYSVSCAAEEGLIVRFPAENEASVRITVNGEAISTVRKTVDGFEWLMVPVRGRGEHIITIEPQVD